uniref:Polysaccharide biosynthesis domain containing 1 n=1 Tax=Cyprinus carpio TaxID=7962 RepID=A0A8C2FWF4_CYPCA
MLTSMLWAYGKNNEIISLIITDIYTHPGLKCLGSTVTITRVLDSLHEFYFSLLRQRGFYVLDLLMHFSVKFSTELSVCVFNKQGVEGATAAAHALSLPAEAYGNDARLEVMWAMKAYNHAEVYYNLISSVDPKFLKLTKSDEQIYTKFREEFPDLSIQVLDPELLKSADAKEKWRPFCNQFEGVVEDFNYGTLLRLDCQKDYTEENTVFATRIQFYAIEIARNREGYNDFVHNANSKTKQQKKDKSES